MLCNVCASSAEGFEKFSMIMLQTLMKIVFSTFDCESIRRLLSTVIRLIRV